MKLNDWLTANYLTVNRFAKNHNLCKESLYSYINGGVPRSNVALKIVKATGGRVALEDLVLSEKLIAKIKLKQQKLRLKMERDKARREEAKRLKEATAAGL